jgi:hypothetical protein
LPDLVLPEQEDCMQHYLSYEKAITPAGAIVVRFYHVGDEVRGQVRQVTGDASEDEAFPGEELSPADALRFAVTEQQSHPGSTVYIELTEGIEWNAEWDDVTPEAK